MHKKNDSDATKNSILTAALKLFGEHGYHKTSISMVAKEAKVYRSSIAFYFGTKTDLLRGVFDHFIEKWMLDAYGQASAEDDKQDKLEQLSQMVDVWLNGFAKNPVQKKATFRLAIESAESENPFSERSRVLFDSFHDMLTNIFVEGQKNNSIRNGISPRALANVIMLTALGYQYGWYLFPGAFAPEETNRDVKLVLSQLLSVKPALQMAVNESKTA